jgi:hypothetical protein
MLQAMRSLALVLAVAGLFSSCSDADNAALSFGSSPPTALATTTSLPTSQIDSAPISEGEAASPRSAEDSVTADFLAAMAARRQCGIDPANCNYEAVAIPGSRMDELTRSTMSDRIKANIRAVEGRGDTLIRVEGVSLTENSASVTACAYDTVVLFDVADPADPSDDIVFNDTVESARVKWELHKLAGRWLIVTDSRLGVLTGGDLCAF